MAKESVVIDQDACISCGACVAVCPGQALELDENGKARLIWDKCTNDFECVKVCPVNCIWQSSQAPESAKSKAGWYRLSGPLSGDLKKEFEEWKSQYGIKWSPI
ncbi:MAG: 4Fe-4S binding protein [Desulfurococcales archaeon]|jgi:ferredoxin|nr:4Fe-4S binding protein [Desulfurococcales archaeon]